MLSFTSLSPSVERLTNVMFSTSLSEAVFIELEKCMKLIQEFKSITVKRYKSENSDGMLRLHRAPIHGSTGVAGE